MDSILPILLLLIGLAIGVTATWLDLRAKGDRTPMTVGRPKANGSY